jgi:hypothetical protein
MVAVARRQRAGRMGGHQALAELEREQVLEPVMAVQGRDFSARDQPADAVVVETPNGLLRLDTTASMLGESRSMRTSPATAPT